jgi:carbon-monoxide dehydrogenase medium subunit
MKPAAFTYQRPAELADALALLAGGAGMVRPLSGGQSLLPMLNLRLTRPDTVLDLSLLDALQGGASTHGDVIRIGARTTHAAIEDGLLAEVANGYLTHVARGIAYRAIRNRGTVAGSLAHADPAADWPTALSALDARVVLQSPRGQRELRLQDFFMAPFTTALMEDELITSVQLTRRSPETRWAYVKHARKSGEFADAIVAAVLDRPARFARVAVGGLAGTPVVLEALTPLLLAADASRPSPAFLEQLLAQAGPADDPLRLRMHVATLARALEDLA